MVLYGEKRCWPAQTPCLLAFPLKPPRTLHLPCLQPWQDSLEVLGSLGLVSPRGAGLGVRVAPREAHVAGLMGTSGSCLAGTQHSRSGNKNNKAEALPVIDSGAHYVLI